MQNNIIEKAFDNLFYPVILIDNNYQIILFNEKASEWALKHIGLKPEKNKNINRIISEDDFVEIKQDADSIFNTGINPKAPIVSILFDTSGNEYWYEFYATSILIENSTYVMISVSDISNRKRTIDNLAERERRFKALVKNSSDIIAVIDKDHKISYVSDSIKKYLHYEIENVINTKISSLVAKSDQDSFSKFINGLIENENKTINQEFQLISKDQFQLYFYISGQNKLSNPSIAGIILNARDITDRKYSDEMIYRMSRQNELILETAGEGIFGLNPKGMITFINPFAAKLLKYKEEEIIAEHYSILLPDTVKNDFYFEKDNVNKCNNFYFKTKEEELLPVEFFASPIKDKNITTGYVVTFNDITQRIQFEEDLKMAKNEAEQANAAKSNFLAQMSHEIRTPMNSIIGFLELLFFTDLTDQQKEYIQIVIESAKHLLQIINDILDFSKIEKGKLELENLPFSPETFFKNTHQLLSSRASEKNIKYSLKISKNIPCTLGDPFRLKQILTNLAGNAIKFTPPNGEIETIINKISESEDSVELKFCIKDNGIGIPKEKQRIIFNSFTQTDNSVSREFGGTGLGLSISSTLVKLMGGLLELESTPKAGSSFFFTLNLKKSTSLPEESDVIGNEVHDFSDLQLSVLVAEDSENNRKVIDLMLKKLGIIPDFALDGNEALDKYKNGNYDIIFMDGNMPHCDGFQSSRKIRQYESENNISPIKIIALTAKALKGDRDLFIDAGMDDYITKPVSIFTINKILLQLFGTPSKRIITDTNNIKSTTKSLDSIINFTKLETELGLDKETLLPLLSDFINELDDYILKIQDALNKKNLKNTELFAHKLKGTAATYAIDGISIPAAEIEKSASEEININFESKINEIIENAEILKKAISSN